MADQHPTSADHDLMDRQRAGGDPPHPATVRVYDRPERTGLSPAIVMVLLAIIIMAAIAFLAFRFVF